MDMRLFLQQGRNIFDLNLMTEFLDFGVANFIPVNLQKLLKNPNINLYKNKKYKFYKIFVQYDL
jgi:hypothetical protein